MLFFEAHACNVCLQAVKLSRWAVLRDSIYYTFSVTALIVVSLMEALHLNGPFTADSSLGIQNGVKSTRLERQINAGVYERSFISNQ